MTEKIMKEINFKCHACGFYRPLDLMEEHAKIVADAIDNGKSKTEVKTLMYSLDPKHFSDLILEDNNIIGSFYEICYPVDKLDSDVSC